MLFKFNCHLIVAVPNFRLPAGFVVMLFGGGIFGFRFGVFGYFGRGCGFFLFFFSRLLGRVFDLHVFNRRVVLLRGHFLRLRFDFLLLLFLRVGGVLLVVLFVVYELIFAL